MAIYNIFKRVLLSWVMMMTFGAAVACCTENLFEIKTNKHKERKKC